MEGEEEGGRGGGGEEMEESENKSMKWEGDTDRTKGNY